MGESMSAKIEEPRTPRQADRLEHELLVAYKTVDGTFRAAESSSIPATRWRWEPRFD